jgi:hypothetical protein
MSEAKHEHTFVWDGQQLLPCACGADMMAIESVLSAAARDARRVAGEAHYCERHQRSQLGLARSARRDRARGSQSVP